MAHTPDALYYQLGSLVAEMPDLAAPPTVETHRWIALALELVDIAGGLADTLQLRVATENLDGILRERNAQLIRAIVQRALAKAELDVAPERQGSFIVTNSAFDTFSAARRLLGTARAEVLLVDPEGDAKALTDFAVLAPDRVAVRLLADGTQHRRSLESATRRWMQQFGDARPLFVRLSAAGTVRDTLIVVDGTAVWTLGQPLSRLARVAYTTLVRIPADRTAALISAYAARWEAASPLFGG
jgi:hypothetical protein